MASGTHTTHDPTAAFPLDHGFLQAGRTNFRVDKMIVRQDDYVRFLSIANMRDDLHVLLHRNRGPGGPVLLEHLVRKARRCTLLSQLRPSGRVVSLEDFLCNLNILGRMQQLA